MRRNRVDKKKRTLQIIMGVIIAFIMVFSIFEYSMMRDTSNAAMYNGFSFGQDPQTRMYQVKSGEKTYQFYTWPGYLEDIPIDPIAIPLLKNAQVVIYTFDPKGTNLPLIEQVRYDFFTTIPTQPVFAVTKNDSTYAKLPVLTCADAAPLTPVVYLNLSDNASIAVVGSCIVLNANNTDFIRVRDRLMYAYIGVMQ